MNYKTATQPSEFDVRLLQHGLELVAMIELTGVDMLQGSFDDWSTRVHIKEIQESAPKCTEIIFLASKSKPTYSKQGYILFCNNIEKTVEIKKAIRTNRFFDVFPTLTATEIKKLRKSIADACQKFEMDENDFKKGLNYLLDIIKAYRKEKKNETE